MIKDFIKQSRTYLMEQWVYVFCTNLWCL